MKTGVLMSLIDNVFSKSVACSVGDIMLQGKELDEGQFTVVSRYYDILQYKEGKNLSFPFQNVIGYLLYGEKHREQDGNNGFMALIESYEKIGYKPDSPILLDRAASLMNGTHRVAINIWHGFWEMSAVVVWRTIRKKRYLQWYEERGLPFEYLQILRQTHFLIIQKLISEGVALVFVTDRKSPLLDEFLKANTTYYKIWTLPKKEGGVIFSLSLANPNYKVRKGILVSQTVPQFVKKLEREIGVIVKTYARNCTEGRLIFKKYERYINQEQ